MDPLAHLSKRIKQLTKYHKNPMNDTKNIIRKLKTEAPVLSTIIDYSGDASVQEILQIDKTQDKSQFNELEKLLDENGGSSEMENKSRKLISFLQYKQSPKKHRQSTCKKKVSPGRSHKSAVLVEMPDQLSRLKDDLLSLPSIHKKAKIHQQFQYPQMNEQTIQNESGDSSIRESQLKNFYTNTTNYKSKLNRVKTQTSKAENEDFHDSLHQILLELKSDDIRKSNEFCKIREKQCEKLLNKEDQIKQRYELFQNMGRPAAKIMELSDSLNSFEKNVDGRLDKEVAKDILKMDSKRYDLILRHEAQTRKFNIQKFKERSKDYKIDECKAALIESKNECLRKDSFKINKKGKVVFTRQR